MNVTQKSLSPSKRIHFTLLAFLCSVILIRLVSLGMYPLMDKTEARYAEIGREMVATHNWITPQLDPGVPFWGKPPFSFWMTAISFKIFGLNEFAARFPSLILTVLTIVLTYIFGSKLRNKVFGLLSAIVLSTTGLFLASSGSVMTDPSLVFSVTLSMVAFAMSFLANTKSEKLVWGYLFFIGIGISFIAKGPVGWVLTFMPLCIWCIWHKQWKSIMTNFPWITGILLMLIIAAPWYILAEKATPGFLKYFFVGEHWQRFVQKGWTGDLYGSAHAQPKGMIWILMIPATMPWILLFVPISLWLLKNKDPRISKIKNDQWITYIFLWFLSPLMFFSLASNILMTYLLPALPAFAMLMVLAGISFHGRKTKRPWFFSMNVFRNTALFAPVVGLIATFTFLPIIGRQNSQWEIVRAFEKERKDTKGSLFYIQGMPQSADFYTNGDAVLLTDRYSEILESELTDDNDDFFVIQDCDLVKFSPEELAKLKEVGKFKKNRLFEEIRLE